MLFSLDERCQEIIQRIIYAKGYIKIQEIADEMQVSKRSIYYDLEKINEWLTSNGIENIVAERGKGVYATRDQVKKIQSALVDSDNADYHVYSPQERNYIEICSIIVRSRPLHIEDFMEYCDVSRNTIINDLKSVSEYLDHYNLELSYDIKTGYRIIGEPIKKRAIYFMLFPQIWNEERCRTLYSYRYEDIIKVLDKLLKIEDELQVEYTNEVLPTLAMFLTTIDKRTERLAFDDMDKDEIAATKEYSLVNQYFPGLNDGEKFYVTLHLLGSRLQTIPVNVMNKQTETYVYAKGLVDEFERISCSYFDRKDELINAINAHLSSSLYRYRYGIQLGNPLLEGIMTEYQELFELTKRSCKYLERELGCLISNTEVAYLTLHFGSYLNDNGVGVHRKHLRVMIICPNGIGTGNMLHTEVASLLPLATEIENIPMSKYSPNHNFDVVISTIMIPEESNIIVVHPILTDQDRVNILRICMHIEPKENLQIKEILSIASKYVPKAAMKDFEDDLTDYYQSRLKVNAVPHINFGMRLINYLSPSHVQICNEDVNWEEAIRLSCKPLLQNGSIEERYIESIIENQRDKGMSMLLADGLVLAHAGLECGVKQLDVALTVFKKPVKFLNSDKAVEIIISLCAEDKTKHIRVLNDILDIFSKNKNKDCLLEKETIEEIIECLSSLTRLNDNQNK